MGLEIKRPMSAAALARHWGKTPATITGWITRGAKRGKGRKYLQAFKLGGHWMITPEAAQEFLGEFTSAVNKRKRTRNDEADTQRVLALLGARINGN
jgi:hypothetical protein